MADVVSVIVWHPPMENSSSKPCGRSFVNGKTFIEVGGDCEFAVRS
jgi:hypothetical protein